MDRVNAEFNQYRMDNDANMATLIQEAQQTDLEVRCAQSRTRDSSANSSRTRVLIF